MIFRLWIFLCVLLCTLLAYQAWQSQYLTKAIVSVCNQVEENFYQSSNELTRWHKDCLNKAKRIPLFWNKSQAVNWLQAKVSSLGGSHVDLWTPQEMSRMWQGEDKDIGIVVELIEGHFMIRKVYKTGPAYNKLQVGDEILSINGKELSSEWDAMNTAGEFFIQRAEKAMRFDIQKKAMRFPFDAKLSPIKQRMGAAVLELFSFAPVYYNEGLWRDIKQKMEAYDKVVIDLRGNTGGDFVIMLKYLSHFFCDSQDVGYLTQPRKKQGSGEIFKEYMGGSEQIELIETSSVVELRTFEKEKCYSGEVDVLINDETASTAEIFAEAIRLRPGTEVLGHQSSGAVLLAIWYPTMFGRNYSLSVPVATYKNWQDYEIEGVGVRPNQHLNYDLSLMRKGVDSWLLKAANY